MHLHLMAKYWKWNQGQVFSRFKLNWKDNELHLVNIFIAISFKCLKGPSFCYLMTLDDMKKEMKQSIKKEVNFWAMQIPVTQNKKLDPLLFNFLCYHLDQISDQARFSFDLLLRKREEREKWIWVPKCGTVNKMWDFPSTFLLFWNIWLLLVSLMASCLLHQVCTWNTKYRVKKLRNLTLMKKWISMQNRIMAKSTQPIIAIMPIHI